MFFRIAWPFTVGVLVVACTTGLGTSARPSTPPSSSWYASPSLGAPISPAVSPDNASRPTPRATGGSAAEGACSALLSNIPLVIVESGQAKLAGAFEVTGAQLTKYFIKTLHADRNHTNGSDWWDQPAKIVDMCLYDGNFSTMTPGPPEADRSASRVLVVISPGDAQFWASTRDVSNLPALETATRIDPTPAPVIEGDCSSSHRFRLT